MRAAKHLLVFMVLTSFLFAMSYGVKTYLDVSEKSIVKEFLNIPFAMRVSRLIFMNQNIAASQYYQFLALIYSTKLGYPHFHELEGKKEKHAHVEQKGHEHAHGEEAHEGENYAGFMHGPGGKDVFLTRTQVEELKRRAKHIAVHVSDLIDIDYFYDLIDLSNALDPDNNYVLVFGRGWVLNVQMAEKMVSVLQHVYERNEDWRSVFDAGWIALYNLREYDRAREYLKMALRHPDAPKFVATIYSYSFYVDKKYEAAIQEIARQMQETDNHELLTKLEKRLLWYRNLLLLNRAAQKFRDMNGKDITDVRDLVSSRLIAGIPNDNMGQGFVWDPVNREIISKNLYGLIKKK
jgi:hypothetical protein